MVLLGYIISVIYTILMGNNCSLLHSLYPIHTTGNAPVLQLLSKVHMRPCNTVAKCILPCVSYGSFKMFKISATEFHTMGICRRMRACTD